MELHIIPNHPKYKINKLGEVFSFKRKIIKLKQQKRNGYYSVCLDKKQYHIHRLMGYVFLNLEYKSKLIINHIDGNILNNNLNNLEKISIKDNSLHAYKNNLLKINKKPVLKYDLNNNFIKEYESATRASIENKCQQSKIIACCRGRRKTHYKFIWKYKYPEKYSIDLKGFIEIPFNKNYLVNKDGEIYSKYLRRLLKDQTYKNGYKYVRLHNNDKGKNIFIHKIVAETFLTKPDNIKNLVINHKDYNKTNNNIENLEYCSQSENVYHGKYTNIKNNIFYNNI